MPVKVTIFSETHCVKHVLGSCFASFTRFLRMAVFESFQTSSEEPSGDSAFHLDLEFNSKS
jgi:hypothetical protein